jgi:hypothetical protein
MSMPFMRLKNGFRETVCALSGHTARHAAVSGSSLVMYPRPGGRMVRVTWLVSRASRSGIGLRVSR